MAAAEAAEPRYEDLTETTGTPVTGEAAEMMYTRYDFASRHASGRRVLEIGCGAGQGFGLLQRRGATMVLGGDYSPALLRSAHRHYRTRIPLCRLSASQLPFRSGTIDLVLFFEATYYVPDMDSAFAEIARVLSRGGQALFVNANPERPDFIRSPHSVHYHTSDEFRSTLQRNGFEVRVEGAYPVVARGQTVVARARASTLSTVRRLMESLGLVPRTLKGRARLKRLAFGRLLELPSELPDDYTGVSPRTAVAPGPVPGYKVIYVTATCASG